MKDISISYEAISYPEVFTEFAEVLPTAHTELFFLLVF